MSLSNPNMASNPSILTRWLGCWVSQSILGIWGDGRGADHGSTCLGGSHPGWAGSGWVQAPSGKSLQDYLSLNINRKVVGSRGHTAGLPVDYTSVTLGTIIRTRASVTVPVSANTYLVTPPHRAAETS